MMRIGYDDDNSVTSAVRLARLPTEPKDHSAQNNLNTPNTIYMPKAAIVQLAKPRLLQIQGKTRMLSQSL